MTMHCERVIASIIAAELAEARAGGFDRVSRLSWTHATPIGRPAAEWTGPIVDVDSLELVRVATTVSEFFGLHEAGVEDRLLVDRTLGGWASLAAQAHTMGCENHAFYTSGTTGAARRIEHSRSALQREAEFFASRSKSTRRVVSLVPAHHMYGYIHGVLVPMCLEVPVVDAEFVLRTSVLRSLRPGDRVVATPMMWSELAATGLHCPDEVVGVSSGAAIEDGLVSSLLALGFEDIIDVYGATETGALGFRSAGENSFEAIDESRARSRAPDALAWAERGRFTVGPRSDGVIQVAGVNVSPAHVRDVMLTHGMVRECEVRMSGRSAAARLEAFVVPEPCASAEPALIQELRKHAESELPAAARPVAYTFGDAVPMSLLGKPKAWSRER